MAKALKHFETGQKKFWNGQYTEALSTFEKIIGDDGLESSFIQRINTYIKVCKERIGVDETKPKSAEELYTSGVYHLNNGDVEEGISYIKAAVNKEKDNDAYVLSLACAFAASGKAEEAIKSLETAITLNPDNKVFASNMHEISELSKNSQELAELIRTDD
jgi:tetratricopeptide (TPR) repeat protein